MAGKWIEIDDPQIPALDAAGRIFRARLEGLDALISSAARQWRDDPEHVHQLRVVCRRAAAATDMFRPLLGKRLKPLGKQLKSIRKAAGPARDCDVLSARLACSLPSGDCREYLLARLAAFREQVQPPLVQLSKRGRRQKFAEVAEKLSRKLVVANGNDASFFDYSRTALRRAAAEMLGSAWLDAPSFDQLHKLRIASKRLRYTIEIVGSAFPAKLRDEVYPEVQMLQDRLGEVNDHATASKFFADWQADLSGDGRGRCVARQMLDEHGTAESLAASFVNNWTKECAAQLEMQLRCLTE